jgi:hypothetical protein
MFQSCSESNADLTYENAKSAKVGELKSDEVILKEITSHLTKKSIPLPTYDQLRLVQISANQVNRSCNPSCDYNINDCGLLCNEPKFKKGKIQLGCNVTYTYTLLICYDALGNPFVQIKDLVWTPDAGCVPTIMNAYDINNPGNNISNYNFLSNTVRGTIMNHIEQNEVLNDPLIFANISGAGSGNIVTVIPQYCYAFCDLFVRCGSGCCVRSTTFFFNDNHVVTNEVTQMISNAGVGTCTTPFPVDCPGAICNPFNCDNLNQ